MDSQALENRISVLEEEVRKLKEEKASAGKLLVKTGRALMQLKAKVDKMEKREVTCSHWANSSS